MNDKKFFFDNIHEGKRMEIFLYSVPTFFFLDFALDIRLYTEIVNKR